MGEYVNSQNARFDKSHVSCGVLEVHHLTKNTQQTLFSIANNLYNKANPRPAAIVIWSDVIENERGVKLAAEVSKLPQGSGVLTSIGPTINPKTGSTIMLWVFLVGHEVFRKWYQDELANRVTE